MEKAQEYIYYNDLYDIYGSLLNEREQEIFTLFYKEDLSLQEIAFRRNISKSAVGKAIQTIHKKLNDYEDKLYFYEREKKLKEILVSKKDNLIEEIKKIFEI